ncbi:amidohydrolase [Deltaproteobacteria bacterium Smac51]|nr:amidohydrolase [Deltaproteobacteria bacterium Smac51]
MELFTGARPPRLEQAASSACRSAVNEPSAIEVYVNNANLEKVVALRHELHAHPELSRQEVWTKQRLMDFLRKNTKLDVVDRGRWFYAHYASGGARPNIAFRADFDAVAIDETIDLPYGSTVPGVSHKCGHDGHSATLCGLALEVDQNGADRDVFFIFQHAEENGSGAIECVPLIDERGISEIYGYHNMAHIPEGTVAIKAGTMNCASEGMVIHFRGAPAHASQPEDGRNPALAIADLIRMIPELTVPEEYQGLIMCTIIRVDVGEESFGIAASEGRLMLTCRGEFEKEMDRLAAALEERARELAARDGLEVDFAYYDVFPETVNSAEGVKYIEKVCRELGVEVREMKAPMRGSEDIGHFFKRTKGALFLLGIGDRPEIHTTEYDFPDVIIEPAVEIFKGLIRNN